MQTGKFKVYNTLNDWFEEFRLYHRKDGKVAKLYDDLMAATRYPVMILREAKTLEPPPPQGGGGCRHEAVAESGATADRAVCELL